jgi:hypothetical protein
MGDKIIYSKLQKIISGGQTGADIAGLKFAREIGIVTGGSAPRGYFTELGSLPELRTIYGLIEIRGNYDDRTIQNVKDADGTVIFAEKMSDGSVLTIQMCINENKPFLVNPYPKDFIEWLETYNIKILNVAGNRESVSPGIEIRVIDFLRSAINK